MAEVPDNKTGVSIKGADGTEVKLSGDTVDSVLGAMTKLIQNQRSGRGPNGRE
jgi:hypothetical protein